MPAAASDAAVQVSFYVLDRHGVEPVACQIAQKALGQGHRVHIRTASQEASEQLDRTLWTFQKQSFVPHSVGAPESELVRVTLHDSWEPERRDVLINLGAGLPPDFARYARIVEIVGGDDGAKRQSRERFRAYREQGIEPETHKIGA